MIRVLIVDDEPLGRRGIRQLLAPHADLEVIGECRDGRAAINAITRDAPDLVFLDVQMPELGGFEVLRALRDVPFPAVIFVTAYEEYAVRAFETHAIDYLVKPVTEARFRAALAKVRSRIAMREALEASRRLAAMLEAHQPDRPPSREVVHAKRLIVPTAMGELILEVDEIDWIEADDYCAAIHARGKRHLIRQSLASLEERLDPDLFVRVHRSAMVRLACVRELRTVRGDELEVVLTNGHRLPVSRRRRELVVSRLRRLAR
jgi:two-component system LytT family response regulator